MLKYETATLANRWCSLSAPWSAKVYSRNWKKGSSTPNLLWQKGWSGKPQKSSVTRTWSANSGPRSKRIFKRENQINSGFWSIFPLLPHSGNAPSFLRKNHYIVDIDVEITPATFDQAGFRVECFLKLGSQTGCSGFVVSLDAIFYTDFHRSFLCHDWEWSRISPLVLIIFSTSFASFKLPSKG